MTDMRAGLFLTLLVAAPALLAIGCAPSQHAAQKEIVKAQCAEFGAANLTEDDHAVVEGAVRRPPAFPSRGFAYPLVCVWLEYDINDQGRAEDVTIVFKAPHDAHESFDRAAMNSVKGWRYDVDALPEGKPIDDVLTEITFETF